MQDSRKTISLVLTLELKMLCLFVKEVFNMSDALLFTLGGIAIALTLGISLFLLKWIEWNKAEVASRAKAAITIAIVFLLLVLIIILAVAWPTVADLMKTPSIENTHGQLEAKPSAGATGNTQDRTLGMIGILFTLFGISVGLIFQSEVLLKASAPTQITEETKKTADKAVKLALVFFGAAMIWFGGILYVYWTTSPLIANIISIGVSLVLIWAFYRYYKKRSLW